MNEFCSEGGHRKPQAGRSWVPVPLCCVTSSKRVDLSELTLGVGGCMSVCGVSKLAPLRGWQDACHAASTPEMSWQDGTSVFHLSSNEVFLCVVTTP